MPTMMINDGPCPPPQPVAASDALIPRVSRPDSGAGGGAGRRGRGLGGEPASGRPVIDALLCARLHGAEGRQVENPPPDPVVASRRWMNAHRPEEAVKKRMNTEAATTT